MSSCYNVKFVTKKSDKKAHFLNGWYFIVFIIAKKKYNKNILRLGGKLMF